MLANLQLLEREEWYDVTFGNGVLTIGNVVISCESQYRGQVFHVKHSRINKLREVFSLLEEQPATIAVDDDGWLYIKEAIM
jgi:hypothetical protein